MANKPFSDRVCKRFYATNKIPFSGILMPKSAEQEKKKKAYYSKKEKKAKEVKK